MRSRILKLISIALLVIALPATAGATTHQLVSPTIMAKTTRVHFCEENVINGWHVRGTKYRGGLGWLVSTWLQWRASWMPSDMALATPEEQAWAMVRFVDRGPMHGWWPDQSGCTGSY